MEHNHSHFAALTAIAAENRVTHLRCLDAVNLDPEPIYQIFAVKGEALAEAMICRVLEDIAHKLDALQNANRSHSFDEIVQPARRIASIGAQIGLLDVQQAAQHVATSAHQADGVALSATLARLERAFDVAVSEVWRFRDHV